MRSIVLALLLLATLAAEAMTPEARVQKEEGDRLRRTGDVAGATRAYQAALKLDGGYAEAHEALGEVRYASKQTVQAIESFGYAVEIDPSYALAWYNLAFAARQTGDQQKARTAFEHYVALRPTDADGHYGLAETQRALGNREAALAEYQLFIDLAQTTPAQAPRIEKARAAQAELKRGAPVVPAAPMGPAAAPGAGLVVVPGVVPAASTGSAPPPAAAVAAPAASAPGPAAPALATSRAAAPALAPAVPTPALIEKLGAGDRAFLSGEYRPALFAYQDAIYLDPTSAVARIRLARVYLALGHKEQAAQQLKQALELDPGDGAARKLAEELANPAPAAPVVAAPAAPVQVSPTSPRVYKLTDEAAVPPPPVAPPVAPPAVDQPKATRH